jgi:hypothetical protein
VYGVVDDDHREGIPGWRLQRRLDVHGLSTAELRVLRGRNRSWRSVSTSPATTAASSCAGPRRAVTTVAHSSITPQRR